MNRVLSLHDRIHVLVINWNSASRRPLSSPVAGIDVTSLT